MCIFAPHNLLKDPPFSRMDIISCQNVLIYLEVSSAKQDHACLSLCIEANRLFVVGKVGNHRKCTDLFEQPSKQYKVYTKRLVNTPLQLDFSYAQCAPAIDPMRVT